MVYIHILSIYYGDKYTSKLVMSVPRLPESIYEGDMQHLTSSSWFKD